MEELESVLIAETKCGDARVQGVFVNVYKVFEQPGFDLGTGGTVAFLLLESLQLQSQYQQSFDL